MRNTRLANAFRSRFGGRGTARRPAEVAALVGAGLALLGAGTASAATVASPAATHAVHVTHAPAQPGSDKTIVQAKPATLVKAAAARPAAAKPAAAKPAAAKPAAPAKPTWSQIEEKVASQTSPGEPKAADQLEPVTTTGAQSFMPIGSAQQANANTIVQQALAKKMGLRSAVIAVATAMQESQLQNISYGTSASLGLFQQQTDMGWGDAQQIMNPTYSSDAFLTALQQYQSTNPGWAQQPLWQTAQGVQKSGFPTAYAKWETQAAQLVQQAVSQQV
jgi:hypothetical protein